MRKAVLSVGLVLGLGGLAASFSYAQGDPPVNRVPLSKARAIALRKAPGKVRDFEFEVQKGKWVYFFKIAGKDEKFHYIVVDAVTGRIISKTTGPMPVESKPAVTPVSTKEPTASK